MALARLRLKSGTVLRGGLPLGPLQAVAVVPSSSDVNASAGAAPAVVTKPMPLTQVAKLRGLEGLTSPPLAGLKRLAAISRSNGFYGLACRFFASTLLLKHFGQSFTLFGRGFVDSRITWLFRFLLGLGRVGRLSEWSDNHQDQQGHDP